MLTIREQMAKGIFDAFKDISTKDPEIQCKKEEYLRITEDGYVDYDVPEDVEYLSRANTRAIRMDKSERARKHRRDNRRLKTGYEER